MASPWTEEINDRAKHLWEMGVSAAAVAANISSRYQPVTRNAVIGRAHREKWDTPNTKMGDPGLRKPRKPRTARPNGIDGALAVKIRAAEKRKFPKNEHQPITNQIESRNMTLLELGPRDCRYPTSPDSATSHLFCGAAQEDGMPYCAAHARIAYRPTNRQLGAPSGTSRREARTDGADREVHGPAAPKLPHNKTRSEHAGSSS